VTDPTQVKRGVCCAGHKALYAERLGGLPDKEFLTLLDPENSAALRDRLYEKAHDATASAGSLSPVWAAKLGLPAGIAIAIGEMDVHYGAIGSGRPPKHARQDHRHLDLRLRGRLRGQNCPDIPGICSIVKGATLPGFYASSRPVRRRRHFQWWSKSCARATPTRT